MKTEREIWTTDSQLAAFCYVRGLRLLRCAVDPPRSRYIFADDARAESLRSEYAEAEDLHRLFAARKRLVRLQRLATSNPCGVAMLEELRDPRAGRLRR